tara:strand:+ start:2200 stop:2541 length:342 start_codon:yes stop_codon:yes gene_type:complete
MSEDRIKTQRRKGGVWEDKDTGGIFIGNQTNEASIKIDGDILLQPGSGKKLKSTSPLEYIISGGGGGNEIAGLIPGMPPNISSPSTFPYYNYIIPVTVIAAAAITTLLIKTEE